MIVKNALTSKISKTLSAIESGTVFTGRISSHTYTPGEVFLRIRKNVVSLTHNYLLYPKTTDTTSGFTAEAVRVVEDYVEYPNATLSLG